jgi:hypothetical protein
MVQAFLILMLQVNKGFYLLLQVPHGPIVLLPTLLVDCRKRKALSICLQTLLRWETGWHKRQKTALVCN